MKKKGLLISTIVMVVVLIAALTTSTYAWITASSRTSIEGFNVNVVSDNALNIGLRQNYSETYNANDGVGKFVNGTCTFSGATDGTLNTGSWSGNSNLGPTVDHQIDFGDVTKAIGFTTESISEDVTTLGKDKSSIFTDGTAYANYADKTVFAANQDSGNASSLSNVTAAVANGRPAAGSVEAVHGDYAYLWMGASPTKKLSEAPKLHIFVQSTGSDRLGIAAAIHVAYSVNGSSWTDVDAFGNYTYETPVSTATEPSMPVATDEWGIEGTSVNGMADVEINGFKATEVGELDQVQFIIYLAGDDDDCIDTAKDDAITIKIGIYFETHDASASDKPTSPAIDAEGKLTLTGIEKSTVQYSVDGMNWETVDGTWTGTNFTAKSALPETVKGKTVQVRQTAPGKNASEAVTVAAASNQYK